MTKTVRAPRNMKQKLEDDPNPMFRPSYLRFLVRQGVMSAEEANRTLKWVARELRGLLAQVVAPAPISRNTGFRTIYG